MKQEIWARKLNEKYGFTAAVFEKSYRDGQEYMVTIKGSYHHDDLPIQDKYDKTKYHTKKKKGWCGCGTHSINGYKEKSKYGRWKRFRLSKYKDKSLVV